MEVSNKGGSLYHRFQASYCRSHVGELRYTAGPDQAYLRDHWPEISADVVPSACSSSGSQTSASNSYRAIEDAKKPATHELALPNGEAALGMLLRRNKDSSPRERYFEDFFATLLLKQLQLPSDPSPVSATTPEVVGTVEAIVTLFDTRLRYASTDDQWAISGHSYFRKRVEHFVSRNARLQLCLPAFPCKSSNPDKVAGDMPDRGEEIALTTLHQFVKDVSEVYPPSAKIWVISDGHVFSDCSE
jgi:hypothetical protein